MVDHTIRADGTRAAPEVAERDTGPHFTNRKWRRMVARGVVRELPNGRLVVFSKRNPKRRQFPKAGAA